jgi:hypothetical protein
MSETELAELELVLSAQITKLDAGLINVIEYGDPTQLPGSYESYIRVTKGSTRYRSQTILQSKSSDPFRFSNAKTLISQVMNLVRRYHQPTEVGMRLRHHNRRHLTTLTFFSYHDDSQHNPPDDIETSSGILDSR